MTEKRTDRTLAGLREMLFDELDGLRNGTREVSQAHAAANIAKHILMAAKLQLDYERAWGKKEIGDKLRAIALVPESKPNGR